MNSGSQNNKIDHESFRQFFPKSQFGGIREVAPLTMGMSGARVYLVKADAGVFVLRIHGGNHESWKKTNLAQEIASKHQVAPVIIHSDEAERATVSINIAGISFDAALAGAETREFALKGLISSLIKLHAIPPHQFPEIHLMDFARTVWKEQVQRPGFPEWAVPLGQNLNKMENYLLQDDRKVVSHGDLHPANMLWDGQQVWLVDWERAGLAHPYLDLATICNFLSIPDEPAFALLAQQEQRILQDKHKALFESLREFCRTVYGAVFIRQIQDINSVQFMSKEETPSLQECFALLSSGKLDLSKPKGMALIGSAFFKQCKT